MPQITPDIYLVREGDTLSQIAKTTGVAQSRLARLNGLKNPNHLEIGQPLYLSERAAFSVRALFLDALRHPIENLAYQLVIDGKTHLGKTGKNGLSDEQISRDADSSVKVLIKDFVGNWQQVGATISDYGAKLITLISPYVSFKDQLDPHPNGAPTSATPANKPPTSVSNNVPLPKQPTGQATRNNPAVKTKKKKGKGGESVIAIGIALPEELLAYMQAYEDTPISPDDWMLIARDLKCEINVLKAIAKVESGGRNAFWVINDTTDKKVHAPKIMFERHYFHRLTCANGPAPKRGKQYLHGIGVPGCNSPYDIYPDICWPTGYRDSVKLGSVDKNMPHGHVERKDIRDNGQDYLRLINAYRLNKEIALKSASWGKFQILGVNHANCDVKTLTDFIKSMCKSEKGQIVLLAGFIKKKRMLWKAVKDKNWPLISYYYNGPNSGSDTQHAVKLKAAYEYYCKTTT